MKARMACMNTISLEKPVQLYRDGMCTDGCCPFGRMGQWSGYQPRPICSGRYTAMPAVMVPMMLRRLK